MSSVSPATLDAKIPPGALEEKWDRHRFDMRLVNPANKRRFHIIVVGTGLAGGSAAATLGELGYNVTVFTYHDSPRRAHSIAAQGGINAAKNYRGDGDSIFRLFHDTIKGGDYRSREANVYRLAQVSVNIIDQCVAQGVPFAREYGGLLDTRSFGGAQVSRTFYARGQTGQQLLLGAYQALERQIALGKVKMYNRHEMLDVVIVDGRDSSEVWSAFRVGRHARPFALRSGPGFVEAAHDGYRPVIHRRRLELRETALVVTDRFEGAGRHTVDVFFHLVPGAGAGIVMLDPALARSVEPGTFHPQFEAAVPNEAVHGRWAGCLPVQFQSQIALE